MAHYRELDAEAREAPNTLRGAVCRAIVNLRNPSRGVSPVQVAKKLEMALEADLSKELLEALESMLEVQSKRRHPLGLPDEGIAYMAAKAAQRANAIIAKARDRRAE